ncbi:MAG: hypothetical protein EA376_00565 [Phycisphaeraceae bacterium]|nr:MAG: hypothetical protein EA376_00565 [Phycisphaeraceae bacterium]
MLSRMNLVRWAAVCLASLDQLVIIAELMGTSEFGYCILPQTVPRLDETTVVEWANVGLSGSSGVDWDQLIAYFCPQGDIVLRPSGSFDDPSASVDLFFDPELVPLLDLNEAGEHGPE